MPARRHDSNRAPIAVFCAPQTVTASMVTSQPGNCAEASEENTKRTKRVVKVTATPVTVLPVLVAGKIQPSPVACVEDHGGVSVVERRNPVRVALVHVAPSEDVWIPRRSNILVLLCSNPKLTGVIRHDLPALPASKLIV